MAQQQARDEAGNIWNVDEAGNVISLASPAPQNGASVVASNPVQAARQSVDLGGAQLGNQRTSQQIALEAAKVPYAPRQAAADTSKAEAEAATAGLALQKAQREAALPVSGQVGRQNLQRAIDDIKRAFAAGPGQTSGIAGLADYLPTTENQQFDAAGNSVRGFVGPALGLTGGQLNTEKEAQRAVGPYIPQAGDRDAVILDKIRRLQGLADAMGGTRRNQQSGDRQAISVATVGGGNGPAGYDVAGVGGVTPGSGGGDGGSFINAAGIKMAQRMSQAYNRGASASDINKLLRDNGYQELGADGVRAIEKRGPINFAPPAVDDTRGSVGRALGDVASSPLGAYAISAGDAVTAGTLDNIAGGQAGLAMDYAREQNPTASLLGSITGGALAAGGAEIGLGAAGISAGRAALAGDALYGAAYGAGSADDGQSRLGGATLGGALGVGGGVAGRALARGIGGTLTGVQNANVQGLRAAGVPLTAGQATGGVLKGVEDRLSGLPLIGDAVNARRLEGLEGFNRAALNEAVQPLAGQTNPIRTPINVTGPEGVEALRAARQNGYSNAVEGRIAVTDPEYDVAYRSALSTAGEIPNTGPAIRQEIESAVPGYFDQGPQTGVRQDRINPNVRGALPQQGVAPAFIGRDGKVYVGSATGSHFTAATPELRDVGMAGTGFADSSGNFYNRADALDYVNKRGENIRPNENMAGELDALDYREQSAFAGLPSQPEFREVPVYGPGSITGRNAQAAIKELKGIRRARDTDALGHRTGQSVRQAENALQGLFERQSPGFANDLARANEVQTNLKTIEAAASNAANQRDGLFTAAQLNRASVQTGNRLTGSGATTSRPFFRLATAGQDVLPSTVPDSGTAGRVVVAGGLGLAGLGGGAGAYSDGAEGAGYGAGAGLATAALLAAGGSRAGQNLLVRGLLDRPQVAINLGRRVQNRAIRGGIFGAPLLAGATPVLLPAQ